MTRALVMLPLALALSALAGCVDAPAVQSASTTDVAATAAATVDLAIPLAFEGLTPMYAEACAWSMVAGRCAATPGDFSKIRYEPELNGTATSLTATITWAASTPTTQQMTIFAGYRDGDTYRGLGGKRGPSPLTLELADLDLPEGATLFIGLAGPAVGQGSPAGGASASASPQSQPWKLEGEAVLKAAAEP